ncbi:MULTISPECIES: hypothetical protein [Dyadobacter]|uniref:Uncharacterized protein n=1 Tax=Dyadobacter chenhuakuii TaxID=2909339 RepID=A0A9X1TU50_9BACT|nr:MULTISPECIES: hypothetical protein [Dyadobacter]MCE7071566.1 hypothetical protein [Dyadobacter sp. CY327]MCF2493543.1 hypothetical protein [Dyadobacter chenhuakuii]MCF2500949.1 hypothetical protein [Dyadobacter chenhuakuii]MCF2519223.1 hypothetical protein [Dyadobacter sp. CY351]USJ30683.1 hypothetical protein NFI80_22835 [Dyadobacter chenhuakuii]
MLKSLCLILLTAFLICKATDVASLLLAKEKSSVVCDTGTCDNEKTEVEKISDDQLLISHSLHFDKSPLSFPLSKSFSFSAGFPNEISLKLLSPPPELI